MRKATCAREEPQKSLETSQSGGGYFTADQQCQLAMGQDSYFCRSVQARKGFDRMCRHLYCYLPDDPGYCGSIIASEFTVCGDGKWCHEGACVSDSSAPAAVSDTCPQGDEPGYQCSPDDCDVSKVKDIYCCQTCALNNESQDARQKTESSKNAINQTSVFTLATTTRSLTTTKTPTSTVNGPGTAENLTDEFGPSQTPVASTSETTRVTARSSGTFPQSTVTTTREKVTTTSSIPATTTTTVFDVSNTDAITLMPNSVSGYPEVEFTTSATIIKNGRHSTVPTTTSTQNEVSSVTTASPGLPETTARMTSTDTTKPSIIDINNTDVVTLSPASPLPTEARDSEWMTTRTTTSAINTTRVDLNTSRPAVTQTLHTPEHFTPQLTTSVAPQITTAGLENETPLQNTKLLRPNTETTHQTATSPATSHIPPIKTSSTIPSSLGDNGKMETDGIPNASTTEALKPSSTSSPTPRTATTKPVKLATTTAASRLSSTDASIKLTSTAKNTPARRPSTTTAPCYSIYCLCVRCYSCYANVCNMFLPGGFYYNQIYGRPF
ncbi:hypothetical protein RRG08_044522 [Elysia crispata]|uniref:ADAMTS cysteine-rich domain-containing protein n=1 Tax=Elysia crispata TaxID=231223 RepID=A0AAE1DED3_9GAST|nr:hypothetical protein RRG08_044522 [Elysia crispata]